MVQNVVFFHGKDLQKIILMIFVSSFDYVLSLKVHDAALYDLKLEVCHND